MKKNSAFALLEILLAVILIGIVTVGSYAIVKSVSSDAGVQKFTRYATTIAENYQPFLNDSVSSANLIWDYRLSKDFLLSIHIPESDLAQCYEQSKGDVYCCVKTGLYTPTHYSIDMVFRQISDSTGTKFFIIELTSLTTPDQKDAIIQQLGKTFSIYCPYERCQFGHVRGVNNDTQLSIVFPKAGEKRP